MSTIHEVAAITSKGQITLPKAIRQLLGISVGGKIAFDLRGDEVVVSKVAETGENADPAIGAFLALIETDIRAGRVMALPTDLAQSILANLDHEAAPDEEIVGEVEL